MADVNYKIEGLEELLKKLDKREMLAKPLRNFWERAAEAVRGFAKLRAPYRTGRLQGSIVPAYDKSDLPLWAEVGTGVTERGVSYPTILELSDRTHYRSGQAGWGNMPTKGWFSSALPDAKSDLESAINILGSDIEAAWHS